MSDPVTENTPKPRSSRRRFLNYVLEWKAGRGDTDEEEKRKNAPPVDRKQRWHHLRRFVGWLWPFKRSMMAVIVLGLITAGLDAVWPLATGWMVDVAAPGNGKPLPLFLAGWSQGQALLYLGLASLAVIVIGRLIGLYRNYISNVLGTRLTQRLRSQLFERLVRLPFAEIHELKTGGIVSRLSGDVDATTGLVHQAIISPISAVVRLVLVVGLLLWINWLVTVVALVLLAGVGLAYQHFIRRIRPVWRSQRKDRGEIDSRLTEAFSGLPVVRSFGREPHEALTYAVGHHTVMRKGNWASLRMNVLFLFWDVLLPLVSLVIFALGGWLVIRGTLRIGEVMSLQILSFQVLNPVLQIVQSMTETQRSLAGMDRVYEILDKPPEMPDRPDAVQAPARIGELRFAAVTFAYDAERKKAKGETPTWVLDEVSLCVPGGTTVALVGPSGAGKSTVTNLVARFYDVTAGAILVDGRDIRDYQLASYRGLLGFVQQEVFLFDGSIAENIAYGRRQATREEVIAAAKAANAWEFIEPLEKGLDSLVGERGVKLSGGQRQRLSIARAMLADPAILILDEATSNLDTHSEQLIQQSLDRLLAGRTTFMIAHRLSTVRHAGLIVAMERGRIVESGSHRDLMAKGPGHLYHDMVERQVREMGEAAVL